MQASLANGTPGTSTASGCRLPKLVARWWIWSLPRGTGMDLEGGVRGGGGTHGSSRQHRSGSREKAAAKQAATDLSSMVRAWVEAGGSRGGWEGATGFGAAGFGGGAGRIWGTVRVSMYTWARLKFRGPTKRQAGGLSLVKSTFKNTKKI